MYSITLMHGDTFIDYLNDLWVFMNEPTKAYPDDFMCENFLINFICLLPCTLEKLIFISL